MDNETLDTVGDSPLTSRLDAISNINISSLFTQIAELHTEGIRSVIILFALGSYVDLWWMTLYCSALLYFVSTPDPNNPITNIAALGQVLC